MFAKRPEYMIFFYNFESDLPEIWEEVKTTLNQERYYEWIDLICRKMENDLPKCFSTQDIEQNIMSPGVRHTVELMNDTMPLEKYCQEYTKFLYRIIRESLKEAKQYYPPYLETDKEKKEFDEEWK